jgi:murein DD-endopeptidase MepM/ murein hydrolase activator NlpD
MKFLFILSFFLLYLHAITIGNGKSLILPLNQCDGNITLNRQTYTILPHPRNSHLGFAIIPIDYYTTPQLLEGEWKDNQGDNISLDVSIINAPYPSEILSVDGAKVTPPPETLARIAQEKAEAEKIYATTSPIRYWKEPFSRPIDSITTSEYGSKRTYNGTLKSYHGGVDFRAKTPLPILASNDGVVVLAKDRYYSGGTVIIDHGEGLYTCYFHFSQIDVKVGDKVSRGQNIGLSGATGRITGPHLHFGVMMYGVQSDPVDFFTQINRLFDEKNTF